MGLCRTLSGFRLVCNLLGAAGNVRVYLVCLPISGRRRRSPHPGAEIKHLQRYFVPRGGNESLRRTVREIRAIGLVVWRGLVVCQNAPRFYDQSKPRTHDRGGPFATFRVPV